MFHAWQAGVDHLWPWRGLQQQEDDMPQRQEATSCSQIESRHLQWAQHQGTALLHQQPRNMVLPQHHLTHLHMLRLSANATRAYSTSSNSSTSGPGRSAPSSSGNAGDALAAKAPKAVAHARGSMGSLEAAGEKMGEVEILRNLAVYLWPAGVCGLHGQPRD